jgi:hypothetical protein
MKYKKDYEKSRALELKVQKHLQNEYKVQTEITQSDEYFPYWDISTTATTKQNKITKFEVKWVGNYIADVVYIELGHFIQGKLHPTGLYITTSDHYILGFEKQPNKFYMVSTQKLKELVETKQYSKLIFDSNDYMLAIFNADVIKQHTKLI